MLRRRILATGVATALLVGLGGGFAPPAQAQNQVSASDTQRSGYGLGWGRNDHGQTRPSVTTNPALAPQQLPNGAGGLLSDAVSIAAGNGFTLWVDHKGMAWGLGQNDLGQLGTGATSSDKKTPVKSWGFGQGTDPKAVKVAAYGTEGIALDINGAVWHWGKYLCSATSYTTSASPAKLTFPSGTGRIVDVVAGSGFALALAEDGRVYAWGVNDHGQLGQGTTTGSATPLKIAAIPAASSGVSPMLDAGKDFGIYVTSTPAGVGMQTWGSNASYQGGFAGSTADAKTPRSVLNLAGTMKALSVAGGATHGLLLTNDGVLRTWGNNGLATSTSPSVVPDPLGSLTGGHHPFTVAAGDGASFAASTDGTVAAWGVDTSGQLGRSVVGNLSSPTIVPVPLVPSGGANPPAYVTSQNGQTYVVADSAMARAPQASYDLGAFPLNPAAGQTAPKQTIVFTNVASKPLSLTSLIVDGAHPGDFTLSGSTCTGTLALDGTCSVTVTFVPTANGARQAGLILRASNTQGGLPLQTSVPVYGRGYTPVNGLANLTLDLAPGSPASISGPGNVIPLANLSPSLIPTSLPPTPSAQLGKIQLGKIQLGKIQLGKIQLGKIQLGKIQLGKIQLGKIPLSEVQLGKIQLGKIQLGKIQLGKIQLGKIPLLREGGWDALLDAYPQLRDLPVSAITLADLVDPAKNSPDPAITTALPLERVALSDVDVRDSVLAQLSVLSVLAGGTQLSQFAGVDWCADLPKIPNGGACSDNDGLARPLIALDFQGVSQELTRAGSVTIGAFTPRAGQTDPFVDAVWPRIPLSSVTLPGTRVGDLQLTALPNPSAVLDCALTSCTNLAGRKLGDPDVVAALRADASFRELGAALNPLPFAALVEPFMDRASYDWEQLPKSAIPPGAYPNRVTLKTDVDINCVSAAGTTLGIKPPAGFVSIPGTTTLTKTRGSGTVALADPVPDATRGLVISVPSSSFTSTGPIACTDDSAHLTVLTSVLPTGTAGSYRATADARTSSVAPVTATQATPLTVTGLNDLPTLSPSGPAGIADALVFGTVTVPGQVQYVPFDAPAGKVVEVTVSQQTSDFDAVLYYPQGASLDPALSTATPPREVPFGEAASVEPDALHPTQTTYGGALQDIPLLTDRPVAAIAATRGTDTEQLSAVARQGTSTRHVAAVYPYNQGTGSYVLRIRLTDPPALASCTTVPVTPTAPPTAPLYDATSYAGDENTLVLVSTSRLQGRYPSTAAAALTALSSYVHSGKGGVKGQVLQVDSDAGVRAAYAAWDAAPCDPLKADGVVRAINALVYSTAPGTVKYVVIAGGDELVPHARLEDHTRDGNEREEAGDIALNGGNPLAASFAAGYYLSDDPYGTKVPESVLGQVVYRPQAQPSRLGEDAASIAAQANAFVASNGVADPQTASSQARTAVATDYDFLTKGGDETASALTAAGYATDHGLTGQSATWTKAQLDAAWLSKPNLPSVAALNMHYDQYRGLPALGNATGDLSQVYDTADIGAGPALTQRVVFTVGCHSGLNVPDSYASANDPAAKDFAQAYGSKGLAAMIGNYGFGYADTTTVAYSAQLQSLFAQGLAARYDLGTALSEAKRLYLNRLAGLSAYDLKSVQQVVVWGLPQYRLSSAAASVPPPAPLAVGSTEPITGLTSQAIDVGTTAKPLAFGTVNDGGSTHLTAAATDPNVADRSPRTVAVPGRPVLPAQFTDVPQVMGKVVKSVVPVSLTSDPTTSATSTFARPSVDHAQGAEPQSIGVYPATLGHVGTALNADGSASNTLVVTPQEVFLNGTTPGAGTVRTFPRSQWLAYYGDPGDNAPPTITRVGGFRLPAAGGNPATTSYQLDVVPAAGKAVSRVFVLALPASGSGTWVRTELVHGVGNRWTGGAAGILGEFHAYAIGSDGSAASSTQKGAGWQPDDLVAPIDGAFPVKLQAPGTGWFTGSTSVQVVSNGGPTTGYRISVDGGAPVASPATVSGDGVHTVRLVAPDGSFVPGGLPVLIDAVVPVVTISDQVTSGRVELHDSQPFTTTIAFGPSGPLSVTDNGVNGSFAAATVGAQALTVTAKSVAGLLGSAARPYRVVYGSGSSGFASPVAGVGMGLNIVVPGLVYGFSYDLVDHFGTPVTTGATTGNAVSYVQEACPSTSYKIQLPKISGATAQPVHTGGGTYTWDLTTPNSGVLVCDRMTVTANDGYTTFAADLQITP